MSEVEKLLLSPVFWVGTVFTSAVISIAVHYLIKWWDNSMQAQSERLAQLEQARLRRNLDALNRFVETRTYGVPLMLHRATATLIVGLVMLLLSIGALAAALIEPPESVAQIAFLLVGVAAIIVSLAGFSYYSRFEGLFSKSKHFFGNSDETKSDSPKFEDRATNSSNMPT